MRLTDQIGYVLRRQDYGDTSLLVDLFTRSEGRLRVIAKGARAGKSAKVRMLQPFSSLTLGWSGRSELKTLVQLEPVRSYPLGKEALLCGFYINELLWNFLEVSDPHEVLFDQYTSSLQALSEGAALQPALRNFEFFLLQDVGYGVSFDLDADTGEPLDPGLNYVFELEKGLVRATDQTAGFSGELYQAIANQDFSTKPALSLAKALSRQMINHRLNGRELHSRKWFVAKRNAGSALGGANG